MDYISLTFIAFVAVVLIAYYGPGRRHQKWVLALANLVFYAFAGLQYLPFMLVTMLATFLTGRKMGAIYRELDEKLAACKVPAEKKTLRAEAKTRAKKSLVVGMAVTIALLVVCKYTGFLLRNVNGLLALFHAPQIPLFKMLLPLGISFYSFMALGYILSVFWRRFPAEEDFVTYAAFLAYFPHVVQGPIDRLDEFKAQISQPIALSYKNITYGAQLALWGLFQKLVIAERLAYFVDYVFRHWVNLGGGVILASLMAYSIQIYVDFAGCMDLVCGVSEMLGIKLRRNFNHPYFSLSMGEFWRRWHMSLMEWFKDFVYYPVSVSALTKNAKKKLKEKGHTRGAELFGSCFPILVVWLISGIWHGADWKFVLWGMFHAALLIGGEVFAPAFEKMNRALHINVEWKIWKLWQMLRTFLLCCLGRLFFRAEDVGTAFHMLPKLLHPFRELPNLIITLGSEYGISRHNTFLAGLGVITLLVVDVLQEHMCIRDELAKRNIVLRWALIYGLLFAVIILGVYGQGANIGSFIYEQF